MLGVRSGTGVVVVVVVVVVGGTVVLVVVVGRVVLVVVEAVRHVLPREEVKGGSFQAPRRDAQHPTAFFCRSSIAVCRSADGSLQQKPPPTPLASPSAGFPAARRRPALAKFDSLLPVDHQRAPRHPSGSNRWSQT